MGVFTRGAMSVRTPRWNALITFSSHWSGKTGSPIAICARSQLIAQTTFHSSCTQMYGEAAILFRVHLATPARLLENGCSRMADDPT